MAPCEWSADGREEGRIRDLLLAVEQDCVPEKVEQTDRAIYRLKHHHYEEHKDIPDILDFKLRSWLHLMGIVERNLDPGHEHYSECSMVFKKTGREQKAAAPEAQERLFSHHRDILHTVESLVNDNYDDTPEIQQRALCLLEGMKVKSVSLNSFRHHFDTCHLRKSIQQLRDKGKGEPEQILKAIRTWANDEEEKPEWPYRSFINRISRQVDLLEAMWKSGNLGPEGFAQSLQEQIMADIQQTLPDDREGHSAMEEIFRRAGESPLKDAVGEILKNRMSAKRAFFSEQVARFEETGDLESLDKAFKILDYLIDAEHEDEESGEVRREKTDAYLSLLRAINLFSPEELVGRQKTPASHWGRGWNEQLAPLDRMKLLLETRRDWVRSSFFSHVRYQYGASPEEMEEVRQLVRNYGMDDEFRKEVEERLTGKE